MADGSAFRGPDEQLVMPWGDGPGMAGHDHLTGVWTIDVASGGAVVVTHVGSDQGYGPRVQVWDAEQWSILVEADDESEFVPYGAAALDSGLILVHGLRRGSGGAETARALLYDRNGTLLDEGRVPVIMNHPWGGGQHAWSSLGPGSAPYLWVRLTDGDRIIEFDDDELNAIDAEIERRIKQALPFYPLDLLTVYYQRFRLDSGVTLQVNGGQGWNNEDLLDPFLVTLASGNATQRWNLSNWDTTTPIIWEADQERLVVVSLNTPDEGGQHWFVLDCPIGGICDTFLVVRDYWKESNSWDWARLQDGKLYVLQTTPEAARIDIFNLQIAAHP